MKCNHKHPYMKNKYSYNYNCINMKVLNFEDFMKEYKLNSNTMNESQLQRVYNYLINPRHSKINSDKGFVNIDNGSMG